MRLLAALFISALSCSVCFASGPTYSVEDTIKLQIGGKLYYSEVTPADSITVIGTDYYKGRLDREVVRTYRYINHSKNTRGHNFFTAESLDSLYNSYTFRDVYAIPDTAKNGNVLGIEKYCGYWVTLKKIDGDFYLDDDVNWKLSFHISTDFLTQRQMDGLYKTQIKYFKEDKETGGFILNKSEYTLIDPERRIYKGSWSYIMPAENSGNLEIIQYASNTLQMISAFYELRR